MDNHIFTTGAAAGSGGILGTVLAFLGLRTAVNTVKSDVDELKKTVVYKDTCKVCGTGIAAALDGVSEQISKVETKIDQSTREHTEHLQKIARFMGNVEARIDRT